MTTGQSSIDDAVQFIVRYLRSRRHDRDSARFGSSPYDTRLHLVARDYLSESGVFEHILNDAVNSRRELESFFAAAWELCRRGILRPGVNSFASHASAPWLGGTGSQLRHTVSGGSNRPRK